MTNKQANRFFNEIDLITERQMHPFRLAIISIYREASMRVELNKKVDSKQFLKKHKKKIEILLSSLYRRTIEHFAQRESLKFGSTLFETKNNNDIDELEQIIINYINQWGAIKAVNITESVRDTIVSIILASREDGLNNAEIAKIIREKTSVDSATRALRIVRTETHSAALCGSFESTLLIQEDLGIKIQKTWDAVEDSRTRGQHASSDGQTVDLNEPFLVDGEKLMYPGDPNGSAGNIINCRCVVTYKRIKNG